MKYDGSGSLRYAAANPIHALQPCFLTFIILKVPSKLLIVWRQLNHSGHSLSLCSDNPRLSLSGCSFSHCQSRLLMLLQHRWALVDDQPWPPNLVNFNTLAFWLNRTSCHSWRNYSLCQNSSMGRTHTCLIQSSVTLSCSQQQQKKPHSRKNKVHSVVLLLSKCASMHIHPCLLSCPLQA